MAPTISRRNILVLAGVAGAAAALPATLLLVERNPENLADELLGALADPRGAAGIGRRWMETSGYTHTEPALAGKIAKRLRAHGWRPGDAPERMRAALAARLRHEFEHDVLVDVAGWRITRTSAELCALAAAHDAANLAPEHPTEG